MSSDHFSTYDAAYVLGALSPEEEAAFEQHLTGCPECTRAVAELQEPARMLGSVDASALAEVPVLPDTILPQLLREVRSKRRRQYWLASAAAACLVVVTAIISSHSTAPATSQASTMSATADVPIQARAEILAVGAGSQINVWCSYEQTTYSKGDYGLKITSKDGRTQTLATWPGVPGKTIVLRAPTTWSASDIAAVEITNASGKVLLRLTAK